MGDFQEKIIAVPICLLSIYMAFFLTPRTNLPPGSSNLCCICQSNPPDSLHSGKAKLPENRIFEKTRRGYGNMAKRTRLFSGIPAADSYDDRLHRPDDRLRCRELPSSLCINIDFTATKTVVAGICCATHGKRFPKLLFSSLQQLSGRHLTKGSMVVLKPFFTISPPSGMPDKAL